MKNIRKYIPISILLFSIFIGIFFRFYKIGDSPVGIYVDEASIGFNAYSILKTGKDEYGKFMPVMFRSFATFQSPVYTYLTVPFVYLFGLSSFSTRFLSALLGVLSIPLLYLLAKQLTAHVIPGFDPESRKAWMPDQVRHDNLSTKLALISAFLLSISPWHIQYSRTAYESNVALFFLLLGSLLFLKSLKKPWLLIFSTISLAISFNAYRAEILIVPVLLVVLVFRFYKVITSNLKLFLIPMILSALVGLLLIAPTVFILRTPGFQARTTSMNILSPTLQTTWGYLDNTSRLGKIINNPRLLSVREFISLYTSYFSPRYLFSLGDSGPRKAYPDFGTFLVWQFPFYLFGLYLLVKEKEHKGLKTFILVLLLVSPIPAALTRDPYSTLRSLPMVIPLTLIISFGLSKFLDLTWPYLNKSKYLILILFIFYSSVRMFISIFYHHDYFRSVYWNYGWRQALDVVPILDPKLPVLVDNSHGDTYIELLFLLNYDPVTYQRDNFEVQNTEYYTNMNRNKTKNVGRFTVKNFQWGIDTDHVNQYVIADNITIGAVQIKEHNLSIVKEIQFPNGEIALRILKTAPKK